MAEPNETGKRGESVACSYLRISGYTILHTNWRSDRYELDIVATNDQELIIVEVKTRSEYHWKAPEEAIDAPKMHRMAIAAEAYVHAFEIDLPIRFDVICMIKNEQSYTVEKHIKDAFYAPVK